MSINLSIKNVPKEWVQHLRQRASQRHRWLQGELLFILEDSLNQQDKIAPQRPLAELRQRGLRTPKESVTIVRKDRDGREGH